MFCQIPYSRLSFIFHHEIWVEAAMKIKRENNIKLLLV